MVRLLAETSAANTLAAKTAAALKIPTIFFIRKNPPFYSEKNACFLEEFGYNFLLYFLERDVMI